MICLLLLWVLLYSSDLRIFIVMTCTITLSYFIISYFHIFLLLIRRLNTWTFEHLRCNK